MMYFTDHFQKCFINFWGALKFLAKDLPLSSFVFRFHGKWLTLQR